MGKLLPEGLHVVAGEGEADLKTAHAHEADSLPFNTQFADPSGDGRRDVPPAPADVLDHRVLADPRLVRLETEEKRRLAFGREDDVAVKLVDVVGQIMTVGLKSPDVAGIPEQDEGRQTPPVHFFPDEGVAPAVLRRREPGREIRIGVVAPRLLPIGGAARAHHPASFPSRSAIQSLTWAKT